MLRLQQASSICTGKFFQRRRISCEIATWQQKLKKIRAISKMKKKIFGTWKVYVGIEKLSLRLQQASSICSGKFFQRSHILFKIATYDLAAKIKNQNVFSDEKEDF